MAFIFAFQLKSRMHTWNVYVVIIAFGVSPYIDISSYFI